MYKNLKIRVSQYFVNTHIQRFILCYNTVWYIYRQNKTYENSDFYTTVRIRTIIVRHLTYNCLCICAFAHKYKIHTYWHLSLLLCFHFFYISKYSLVLNFAVANTQTQTILKKNTESTKRAKKRTSKSNNFGNHNFVDVNLVVLCF